MLCMLQCDINTSSDHPCFEAIVVFPPPFPIYISWYAHYGCSGAPVTDFIRRNLLHFLDEK